MTRPQGWGSGGGSAPGPAFLRLQKDRSKPPEAPRGGGDVYPGPARRGAAQSCGLPGSPAARRPPPSPRPVPKRPGGLPPSGPGRAGPRRGSVTEPGAPPSALRARASPSRRGRGVPRRGLGGPGPLTAALGPALPLRFSISFQPGPISLARGLPDHVCGGEQAGEQHHAGTSGLTRPTGQRIRSCVHLVTRPRGAPGAGPAAREERGPCRTARGRGSPDMSSVPASAGSSMGKG